MPPSLATSLHWLHLLSFFLQPRLPNSLASLYMFHYVRSVLIDIYRSSLLVRTPRFLRRHCRRRTWSKQSSGRPQMVHKHPQGSIYIQKWSTRFWEKVSFSSSLFHSLSKTRFEHRPLNPVLGECAASFLITAAFLRKYMVQSFLRHLARYERTWRHSAPCGAGLTSSTHHCLHHRK